MIIGGRLGRDPEIRAFEGGDRIAWLSIATTEQWMSGGERQEKTDWHSAVVFKKAAVAFAERNLKKDDLVIVEGRLENRSYQKDGQTHHVTEIAVREGRGDLELMAKAASERPQQGRRSRAGAQPGGAG